MAREVGCKGSGDVGSSTRAGDSGAWTVCAAGSSVAIHFLRCRVTRRVAAGRRRFRSRGGGGQLWGGDLALPCGRGQGSGSGVVEEGSSRAAAWHCRVGGAGIGIERDSGEGREQIGCCRVREGARVHG